MHTVQIHCYLGWVYDEIGSNPPFQHCGWKDCTNDTETKPGVKWNIYKESEWKTNSYPRILKVLLQARGSCGKS